MFVEKCSPLLTVKLFFFSIPPTLKPEYGSVIFLFYFPNKGLKSKALFFTS